MNDQQIQK